MPAKRKPNVKAKAVEIVWTATVVHTKDGGADVTVTSSVPLGMSQHLATAIVVLDAVLAESRKQ
jgi:hypothetical protein